MAISPSDEKVVSLQAAARRAADQPRPHRRRARPSRARDRGPAGVPGRVRQGDQERPRRPQGRARAHAPARERRGLDARADPAQQQRVRERVAAPDGRRSDGRPHRSQRDALRQVPARADLELEPLARRAPGRVRDARRRSRSADALARGAAREHDGRRRDAATTCCKIKQEYEASRLETQKAIENRDMLKLALEREDKLLESLQHTSYLRAMGDTRTSLSSRTATSRRSKKGKPLYGCKLGDGVLPQGRHCPRGPPGRSPVQAPAQGQDAARPDGRAASWMPGGCGGRRRAIRRRQPLFI